MIKIKLTNQTIQITGDEEDLKKIAKFQTYDDTSACFSRGGYDIRKIKHVALMKIVRGVLVGYAGLTKEIMIFCKNNNIKVESFDDKRIHFDFQNKEYSHDELRKYFNPDFKYVEHQIKALQTMITHNKAILCLPTSAGKSSIISAFMRLTNLPILVVVDRATLAAQLANGFTKDGIDCGLNSGHGTKQGYCMVSTIQSVKKIQDLPRFQCVITDESHRASSKSFQNFFASFGCPLKYGFSASPSNGNLLDFAKIRQHLGSIEIRVKAEELMENEVMAKAEIHLVETICEPTFDYPSANSIGIVHNELRNKQIKEICERYDGYVCILVKNIDHGEILEKMIPGSVFLRGENTLEERTDIINKFNNGEVKYLIGSNILNEGISISNMRVLILGGAGKAKSMTVQRIGRVLRITKDKKKGIFYDFIDRGNKWLLKHSKQRITIYKNEGYSDIRIEQA